MMHLTMTGEYAIRAMLHLASRPYRKIIHIGEISREWGIPEAFLRKIVAQLVSADLVRTERGIRGGISLTRPAEQITVLDVIEAVEGRLVLNRCLLCSSVCSRDGWCGVHAIWQEAQEAVVEILTRKSLAQIAAESLDRRAALDEQAAVPTQA